MPGRSHLVGSDRDVRPVSVGLADWAKTAAAPYQPARHHHLLLDHLEAVADGRIDRLLVAMPPGSAKSTYCSVVLPAWWLHRNPRDNLIAVSHTEALAHYFGRRARAAADQHAEVLGMRLARGDRAAGRWSTEAGGEYFATGVRGPVVGRRADLVILDDPVKGHAEADSATARDSLWRWFQVDLTPRLKPGGRIVLVMTRWHEDDLGGRLLASGEGWQTISLPALAEAGDPLGRAEGEPLWPEWESAESLARTRRAVGERMWAALYQQKPRPDTGTLFKSEWMTLADEIPVCTSVVRAWDLAATEATEGNNPDYTVGLKLGRTGQGRYCVLDVVRLRGGPLSVENAIVSAAEADGYNVAIGLPQDPGQAGKQQVAYLRKRLSGWRVSASPETGSKRTRAAPASAQFEAGLVQIVRAPWTADLLNELTGFPNGPKDDQVDALTRAFALLEEPASETYRLRYNLLGR